MGKGFNNYMCKKFFHPASRDNLKRVWMAEQQTELYKKKQEELRVQYEKEQDLHNNKAIMSKESKEKLSVNFLYEPPPGHKKDREREDDEPEFKFEWQRKYNAPRESYCKGDQEIRDQPFGIQVRNVRCIKCHKWGHINTDKECPMYNQSGAGTEASSNLNPSELIRQMREDGLAMKRGAVGLLELPGGPSNVTNQQLIPSSSEDEDHMNESELKFLEGLSTKKKLKLLRKLEKMEKKKKKKNKKKKEKKRDRLEREKGNDSDSSGTDSDSSLKKSKKKIQSAEGKDVKRERAESADMKEADNDLYAVLGRKMDFDGPPQGHSFKGNFRNGHKVERKRSRSTSRGRSRSRSPTRDRKKYDNRYKGDSSTKLHTEVSKNNHTQNFGASKSRDSKGKERSDSPEEGRRKNESRNTRYDGPKGYEMSSRREKNRRSRSRSREPHRRQRSPDNGSSRRNGYSNH